MKIKILPLLLFTSFLLMANSLFAISYTWNGTTGNWTDVTRWAPNGVPGMGDTVTINSGTVTLDIAPTITVLVLGGKIVGSNDLTVTGTLTTSNGATFGDGTATGTVTVAGAATLNGTTALIVRKKTLILNGGGTLNGYMSINEGGLVRNAAGQTLTNTTSAGFYMFSSFAAPGTFDNLGAFVRNGTGGFSINSSITFQNSGTVQVLNGFLDFAGTHTGGGTSAYSIAGGAYINFSSGTTTFTGSTFSGAGEIKQTGGTVVINAGTTVDTGMVTSLTGGTFTDHVGLAHTTITMFNYNGTGTPTISGNLTLLGTMSSPGNLNIPGNLTLSGKLANTGDTTTIGGTLTTSNGATFGDGTATGTVTVAGAATLNGTTALIVRKKTLILNGGGTLNGVVSINEGGLVRNAAGQTLTNTTSAGFYMYSGFAAPGTFDNLGTFVRNGTGGYSINSSITFQNSGTVQVLNGFLDFAGTHTGGGTSAYSIAGGAYINFSGGTTTFTGSTFSGAGEIKQTGGTVVINAGTTVDTGMVTSLTGGTFTDHVGLAHTTITMFNYNGTGTPTISGNLTLLGTMSSPGNLTIPGNLTLSGKLANTGDTTTIGGTLTTSNGATFGDGTATGTVTVAGAATLNGTIALIVRKKTLILNGGGTLNGYMSINEGGLVRNAAGQTLTNTTSAGFYMYSGFAAPGTFDNLGTFVRNGTGSFSINSSITFQNSGTVQVLNGFLDFAGTHTGGGTSAYSIAGGAYINFSGGTATFTGSTFSGAGEIKQTGGTVVINAGTTVDTGMVTSLTGGTFTDHVGLAHTTITMFNYNGTGTPTISGNLTLLGTMSSPGNLTIPGNLTCRAKLANTGDTTTIEARLPPVMAQLSETALPPAP
ncbi:MAG: hypothetical protein IPM98_06290 [Lewinellaceae bacterium]|nr:hypothetical protein [Lewinellaceae bacterium]